MGLATVHSSHLSPRRKAARAFRSVKRTPGYKSVSTCLKIGFEVLKHLPMTRYYGVQRKGCGQSISTFHEYVDHSVGGTNVRRPSLDQLLKDANRRKFDAVLVWSCDRLERSTKHSLQMLDDLSELGIQFLSQREAIDTEGPLGRAIP